MKKNQGGYVPPAYIPLGQSDSEEMTVPLRPGSSSSSNESMQSNESKQSNEPKQIEQQPQWSSGICACCDDMPSCCIGCLCPCYLFGKNAQFLACCLLTDGLFLGLPGCLVSCYACGYRGILRSKYNLPDAPCGDFVTHCCCHLCAICQEYREIRERAGDSEATVTKLAVVTAPPVQTMKSDSGL
ncbi:hypothetical protein TSUD_229470 [Trifolium subterraneum]|uniref:Uncharacterized protein n=1 Tax=Trifolium subterraneum TaxID=3900 RepID=A0A2Z6LQM4_TRISU|nr:hypothetical protein TSUD_229470 [Trifolium subterraneum]